ncbi:MAG: hypothetical protein WCP74_12715 [Sphingobacteriia bacterium]|jgi:hypothetical protein
MNNYLNVSSANQMYGSNNAPLGIILCRTGRENSRPIVLMNLPGKVMILNPETEVEKQDLLIIDPNSKIY